MRAATGITPVAINLKDKMELEAFAKLIISNSKPITCKA
jgi:hypothetical protein